MPSMLAATPARPEVEYASALDLTRLRVFRFLVRRQASSPAALAAESTVWTPTRFSSDSRF